MHTFQIPPPAANSGPSSFRSRLREKATGRLLLVLLSLLLSSCSANRFAYNHLDRLARWALDDYVTLSDTQRLRFDRDFADLWQWHRQTELPRYATDLRALAASVDEPWTQARLDAQRKLIEAAAERLVDRAMPASASLLASLDDRQLQQLVQALHKDSDKYRKRAEERATQAPEQRLKRRIKDTRNALKDWIGPLDEDQQQQLEAALRNMPSDPLAVDAMNRAWIDGFVGLLQQRKAPDFESRLRQWLRDPSLPGHEATQAQVEANRARMQQLLLSIGNSLSPTQRQHLRERLLDDAQDCERLAALQPTARQAP